jgi:hypothetical protein
MPEVIALFIGSLLAGAKGVRERTAYNRRDLVSLQKLRAVGYGLCRTHAVKGHFAAKD